MPERQEERTGRRDVKGHRLPECSVKGKWQGGFKGANGMGKGAARVYFLCSTVKKNQPITLKSKFYALQHETEQCDEGTANM